MSAKQGSQARRSTPANLSSAGAARDGAGFPDGFCFGVLFRRKAGGSFRSVRPQRLKLPSRPKKIAGNVDGDDMS
ncbi:hypothetical protein CN210_32185 [Sinorhizobium meliloti]|nr:hypothetical protein CN210_32185 [Sinorhizobium meliloti]